MPTDQSLGLNNHKSILPVEESGTEEHCESGRIGQAAGREGSLTVERELFSEEKVFSDQGCPCTE